MITTIKHEGDTMTKEEIKKINKIVSKLIARNILAGATLEKAKDQAFNRMNKEYPRVLAAWLHTA